MNETSDFYTKFLISIDGWRLHSGLDVDADLVAQPPSMAVYANTGLRAAIEALEANFLSVANWLGGPWFWPVATAFARAHPPSDGRLFLYGDGFPAFLAELEHSGLNRCTSDLAWVDWMCTQAHAAADHVPLTAARLALLPAEALPALHLKVAPATQWRAAPDFPLVELWRNARTGHADAEIPTQAHRGVLVTRPDDSVGVHEVPMASLHLLDALAAGQRLGDAASDAAEREGLDSDLDLQEALGALLAHGALALPAELAH